MILSFKPQFIEPILKGSKIHTIREDKTNRWIDGRVIQGATGVRTKKYNQFFEGVCVSTQKIEFEYACGYATVLVDNKVLSNNQIEKIAISDGFESIGDF